MEHELSSGQAMLDKQILGIEDSEIDDKGRVRVSTKKKNAIGENFTIALLPVGCIAIYPKVVWDRRVAEVLNTPASNPAREEKLRTMGSFAEEGSKFDQSGRFVIPQWLRIAADMDDGEVLLVGCVDHLEMWRKDEFTKYRKNPEQYARERRDYDEKIWERVMSR
jgi:MraZ protein